MNSLKAIFLTPILVVGFFCGGARDGVPARRGEKTPAALLDVFCRDAGGDGRRGVGGRQTGVPPGLGSDGARVRRTGGVRERREIRPQGDLDLPARVPRGRLRADAGRCFARSARMRPLGVRARRGRIRPQNRFPAVPCVAPGGASRRPGARLGRDVRRDDPARLLRTPPFLPDLGTVPRKCVHFRVDCACFWRCRFLGRYFVRAAAGQSQETARVFVRGKHGRRGHGAWAGGGCVRGRRGRRPRPT